jgi:very-short-patch-repair endonuclease
MTDLSNNARNAYRTRKDTLAKARRLRHDMTEAEKCIWYLLRGGRFDGVKFKRQVPFGPYIVDFASLSRRPIVETRRRTA